MIAQKVQKMQITRKTFYFWMVIAELFGFAGGIILSIIVYSGVLNLR